LHFCVLLIVVAVAAIITARLSSFQLFRPLCGSDVDEMTPFDDESIGSGK